MIFKKLRDFGFIYENNIFSYPDNDNVIPALYGYMKNVTLQKHAIFSLNYNFVMSEMPAQPKMFSEYLSGNEREFFDLLSEFMASEGFFVGKSDDYSVYSYRLEYTITPKGLNIMRFYSDSGKLQMHIKFNHSGCYDYYINDIPESVKHIFRRESTCRFCHDGCSAKQARTFEGKEYTDCSYNSFYTVNSFEPGNIEYYKQMILLERKAVKSDTKKKGIKVYL